MYSRILVATDGSGTADVALTEAVRLARTQGATLRIVHVIDGTPTVADVRVSSCADMREPAARAGRAILREAEAFATKSGLCAETRLLEIVRADQRVVDVLAEEARAWPADIVVLGTHGLGRVGRLPLGSVADEFVRVAPEPVLLVGGERPR